MKLRLAILAVVGVAVALYLVRYVGWHPVLAAIGALGFVGFVVFSLCGLCVFVLLGAAWQVLLAGPDAPRLALLIRARLVRDAGAEVLPFSQLGGIVLGVRAAILQGLAAPLAAASMIVDVTTEMLAQIAYAALGVGIVALHRDEQCRGDGCERESGHARRHQRCHARVLRGARHQDRHTERRVGNLRQHLGGDIDDHRGGGERRSESLQYRRAHAERDATEL